MLLKLNDKVEHNVKKKCLYVNKTLINQ